jgi:hypothetical protein
MSDSPGDVGTDSPEETEIPSANGASETDGGPFLLTERDTDEGLLVAVCDADILGDTFENGSVSLTVNEEFYGGDRADETAVIASLRAAEVANVVGEHAVSVAIEAGVVDDGAVLEVGATRHAQLVRM